MKLNYAQILVAEDEMRNDFDGLLTSHILNTYKLINEIKLCTNVGS